MYGINLLPGLTMTPFAPTISFAPATNIQDNPFQLTFSESLTPNHVISSHKYLSNSKLFTI